MKKYKNYIIAVALFTIGIILGSKLSGTAHNSSDKTATTTTQTVSHWTCSMHPQIDLPEFGACPICGMDLIPKESETENTDIHSITMSKNAMALANIETAVVGNQNNKQNNQLTLSGSIQTNTDNNAIQTAHFGGRIEKLLYQSKGDYIRRGSLIARIYSPDLVTAQNDFLEAVRMKTSQPKLYEAVKNKLRNWKISNKQIQQIEKSMQVIQNFNLYADQSGYIDEVLVQQGSYIKEGGAIYRLSNIDKVWAVFDVYEKDIQKIKTGQKLNILVNALGNKHLNGTIDFINPVLNTASRTVSVRATLENKSKLLKPGMLIEGKITLKNSENIQQIYVPKTAVMWTGKRSIVYINSQEHKPVFELREVILGSETNDEYQIISGLKKGERVVVQGTFTVDAAAQLQGKNAMMNQATKKEKNMKMDDNKKMNNTPKKKQKNNKEMKCGAGKCGSM